MAEDELQSIRPSLVNKTSRYFNSTPWGSPDQEGALHMFLVENYSLRLGAADSHPSCFMLCHEHPQSMLKVMAQQRHQNHIICIKRDTDLKPDPLLLRISWCSKKKNTGTPNKSLFYYSTKCLHYYQNLLVLQLQIRTSITK